MQALQIREFLASVTPALSLHFIKISLHFPFCRENTGSNCAPRLRTLKVGGRRAASHMLSTFGLSQYLWLVSMP